MIEPPLPFGNAAARWFYVLLRGLVQRGHRVTAFATCSNPDDILQAAKLFPAPEFDLRCYAHARRTGIRAKLQTLRTPYSYMFSDEMLNDLQHALAGGFDVLHLEQLWSGWMGLPHIARAIPNVHYLFSVDQPDGLGLGLRQRMRTWATRRAERRLLRTYPRQIALTDRLADAIRAVNPAAVVSVVPLGVDLKLYPFDPDPPRALSAPPTVGLIGSFDWTPTILAGRRLIEQIWPAIRAKVPEARLLIVGRNANAVMRAYAGVPGLEVRSDVPDPIPHFREMDVMVYAPPQGSGIKVKIVEALALGTAVVTNADGAEGLQLTDGIEVGLAERNSDLADRAAALLRNPELRIRQRHAGRERVAEVCGADIVLDRLERVYTTALRTMSTERGVASTVKAMPT